MFKKMVRDLKKIIIIKFVAILWNDANNTKNLDFIYYYYCFLFIYLYNCTYVNEVFGQYIKNAENILFLIIVGALLLHIKIKLN